MARSAPPAPPAPAPAPVESTHEPSSMCTKRMTPYARGAPTPIFGSSRIHGWPWASRACVAPVHVVATATEAVPAVAAVTQGCKSIEVAKPLKLPTSTASRKTPNSPRRRRRAGASSGSIGRSAYRRGWAHDRPMGVPQAPALRAMLGEPGEEAGLIHPAPRRVDPDLGVGGCDCGKPRTERIHLYSFSPPQLDVCDRPGELVDSSGGSLSAREHQAPFCSHEERRVVGELPAPGCGTVPGHLARHRPHECPDTVRQRGRVGRRWGFGPRNGRVSGGDAPPLPW